jgi:hypothetical protein
MGQTTLGLLYGIETPIPQDEGDPEEDATSGLLDRFHAAADLARWLPRVIQTYEEPALLGVWIALGGSGAMGIDFLVAQAVPLEALPTYYAEAMAEAQAVWDRFVTYCAAHEQVEIPAARLWLTPTEVA